MQYASSVAKCTYHSHSRPNRASIDLVPIKVWSHPLRLCIARLSLLSCLDFVSESVYHSDLSTKWFPLNFTAWRPFLNWRPIVLVRLAWASWGASSHYFTQLLLLRNREDKGLRSYISWQTQHYKINLRYYWRNFFDLLTMKPTWYGRLFIFCIKYWN